MRMCFAGYITSPLLLMVKMTELRAVRRPVGIILSVCVFLSGTQASFWSCNVSLDRIRSVSSSEELKRTRRNGMKEREKVLPAIEMLIREKANMLQSRDENRWCILLDRQIER